MTRVGELVEGGRLDPDGVATSNDEAVAFGSAGRLGQDLVRDPTEGLVKVLVTTTAALQFSEHGQGPSPGQQLEGLRSRSPGVAVIRRGIASPSIRT